jgi:hypothetical protein
VGVVTCTLFIAMIQPRENAVKFLLMFITDYKNIQILITDGRRGISTSNRSLQIAYNILCIYVCVCLEDLINSQQSVDVRFETSHPSAFLLMPY